MPILPSHDEQLRAIRDESDEFFLTHIDTCLSCYLQDHHNRDGELLLGVYVDGATTLGEVFNELESEFNAVAWELGESRKGYDHDKARQAICKARAAFHPMELDRTLFDPSLDIRDPEEWRESDEIAQAWFLIHWEVPEDDD